MVYSINIIVLRLWKIDIAIFIHDKESKAYLETAGLSGYDDHGHSIRIIIL